MSNMRLLLVDDEERFTSTTKTLLEKRGVETFIAHNGLDAMEVMDEHNIDVVILDVKMPNMDGIEVLRRIKQRHPIAEVIMLTGHSTTESVIEGLKLGAFDYLTKPCDISVLIEKTDEAYLKKQAMEDKIRQVKVDKIIGHPLSVFDKD